MTSANLLDAGFVGWPLTWQRGNLCERLDRAIEKLDWQIRFHQASIHHLHYLKSDHRPLCLKLSAAPALN
jgi:hypothetical protein